MAPNRSPIAARDRPASEGFAGGTEISSAIFSKGALALETASVEWVMVSVMEYQIGSSGPSGKAFNCGAATTAVRPPLPANSGKTELAILNFAEVGYIRLRWERIGVRGYGHRQAVTPHPDCTGRCCASPRQSDLSLWER